MIVYRYETHTSDQGDQDNERDKRVFREGFTERMLGSEIWGSVHLLLMRSKKTSGNGMTIKQKAKELASACCRLCIHLDGRGACEFCITNALIVFAGQK